MVVNEVLCYMQNNFNKHPHALLSAAANGFFTEEEVAGAKLCLHAALEKLKPAGLPRLIK